MSDASPPGEDWPAYLRRWTKRPGWSVARLARESGVHRATIFGWLKGDGGVTVDSVQRIANALGDDPDNALRAAGGARSDAQMDQDVALIMSAPVDDSLKQVMLRKLYEHRERDLQERLRVFGDMIDVARRED